MADAKRDSNFVTTLLAVSSVDGVTPVTLYANPTTHRLLVDLTGGGTGTVTSVSVVSANGFAGTVATATTTPAITISTTINSPVLAGNGTAIAAATTTGTGSTVVLDTTPTLVTPVLGVATATSINKVTLTAPATSAVLTIADGKTLTVSNSITLAGTDATVMTFPTTTATIARTDAAQTFTGVQSMTSPAITTGITAVGASFALINTVSTTVNFAGAATTLNVGGTPSTAVTHSYSANPTANATTKTINFATAGVAGSTTNVNIGSSVASAILGTLSLNFPTILTASNNTTISLWDTNSTTITFASAATTLTMGAATGTATIANATVTLTNATVLNINGASPSIVSSSNGTGSVFNTNILTGVIFGAATTLTVGGTPTTTVTHNYSTNATAAATTKTVNLGTGGAASSTTNVNIGSSSGGTTTVNSATISLGSTTGATTTGTIELGAASDTTLSRSAAGVLAVEGVVIPSISSTNTLTNKRWTRRLTTTNAPGATPTTNTDNVDIMNFTGLATAITSMTTNLSGTPVDGDKLEFRFTDNATARAITWGTSFASTTVALPATTVISTMLRVGLEWNSNTSKWECIATC